LILLPYTPGTKRWLLDSADSPWYPTCGCSGKNKPVNRRVCVNGCLD